MMELRSARREKELHRKDVLDEIERAASSEWETIWDDDGRIAMQKNKSKMRRGKRSKVGGGNFELRVRKDLEEKGWIVDKWSNNVDLKERRIVPCKRKFNPFNKVMTIGTGFPDFICFERRGDLYKVIGVEVKMNGTLSRVEKQKCAWCLKNGIFNEMLVARKVKERNRVRVEYTNVVDILKRMRRASRGVGSRW